MRDGPDTGMGSFLTCSLSEGKELQLRVPAGMVSLGLSIEDYAAWRPILIWIDRDHRVFDVALDHITGIRLIFRDETREVSWRELAATGTDGLPIHVCVYSLNAVHEEKVESTGEAPSRHGRLYLVKGPGAYRVVIPPLHGFLPIPPYNLEVKSHELTELTIKLLRDSK